MILSKSEKSCGKTRWSPNLELCFYAGYLFLQETRTIYQLHYRNWPDHDVPSSIDPILELIWDVRCFQEDDSAPICIHCRYDALV